MIFKKIYSNMIFEFLSLSFFSVQKWIIKLKCKSLLSMFIKLAISFLISYFCLLASAWTVWFSCWWCVSCRCLTTRSWLSVFCMCQSDLNISWWLGVSSVLSNLTSVIVITLTNIKYSQNTIQDNWSSLSKLIQIFKPPQ